MHASIFFARVGTLLATLSRIYSLISSTMLGFTVEFDFTQLQKSTSMTSLSPQRFQATSNPVCSDVSSEIRHFCFNLGCCGRFISAIVDYSVVLGGGSGNLSVEVVDDETGDTVATSNKRMGSMTVSNPKLWWPYSMSKQNFTNMYTLKVGFSLWEVNTRAG